MLARETVMSPFSEGVASCLSRCLQKLPRRHCNEETTNDSKHHKNIKAQKERCFPF